MTYCCFHANGIEIAFPQSGLHIKGAVPFNIIKDDPNLVATDFPKGSDDKHKKAD